MGKATSKSERTRESIIARTAAVFKENGYAGTSLTALTIATGLTKGSIYGNFDKKDEVALTAFDYHFNRLTQYLREKAAKALALWKTSLEQQIKRGIERSEIKQETAPGETAVVIMSLIEGAIMQAKVTGRSTELRMAMNYLEAMIRSLST